MSMKYKKDLLIKYNQRIAEDIYELCLTGEDFSFIKPGQFINISIDGFYLRRPISVCNSDGKNLIVTYKVLGKGTKKLSSYQSKQTLNCIIGLGNGFELPPKNIKRVTLVGGGIGVPPLVKLYEYLKENTEIEIKVVLGFTSKSDIIYHDKFDNAQISLAPQTVMDLLEEDEEYIYSCGPTGMLNALALKYEGQYLLEERMGCGFGACMGCSKRISEHDYKRVCVEGPMFYRDEVTYELEN